MVGTGLLFSAIFHWGTTEPMSSAANKDTVPLGKISNQFIVMQQLKLFSRLLTVCALQDELSGQLGTGRYVGSWLDIVYM